VCFDSCVGVLVICVFVFTVFLLFVLSFLYCFVYVYLFLFDVFLTVHHSIDLFPVTNLMHTFFIL